MTETWWNFHDRRLRLSFAIVASHFPRTIMVLLLTFRGRNMWFSFPLNIHWLIRRTLISNIFPADYYQWLHVYMWFLAIDDKESSCCLKANIRLGSVPTQNTQGYLRHQQITGLWKMQCNPVNNWSTTDLSVEMSGCIVFTPPGIFSSCNIIDNSTSSIIVVAYE